MKHVVTITRFKNEKGEVYEAGVYLNISNEEWELWGTDQFQLIEELPDKPKKKASK